MEEKKPPFAYLLMTRSLMSELYLLANQSVVEAPIILTQDNGSNALLIGNFLVEYQSIRAKIPPASLPSYVKNSEALIHSLETQ